MPSDVDAVRTHRSEQIRTPDQLQQAKRADEFDAVAPADHLPGSVDGTPPTEGVLGQLRTERAHD